MLQKSGAALTLPSKRYLTQSFTVGPLRAKKFARLEESRKKMVRSFLLEVITLL